MYNPKKIYLGVLFNCVLIVLSINAARTKYRQMQDEQLHSQKLQSASPIQQETDFEIQTTQDEGAAITSPIQASPEPETVISETEFNVEKKKKAVLDLVERGIEYFKKHDTSQALRVFTHTKDFVNGELYLFVYSSKGVVLAQGDYRYLLWKNLYNLQDTFGTPIVQQYIDKALKGGGWVTYQWRNATKVSYVQEVKKDGKSYIIGAGYYPHSKKDAVVNFVKGAVALFNAYKAEGKRKEEAFSAYNYPLGRFVSGDLYLYALDFKGTIMAQGERPGLVGANSYDYQDSEGKFVNQEIINKLKEMPDEGIWVSYMSKRARKHAYAERVEDAQGNNYFIACGYYPEADRETAIDLVKKGYTYMKAHGRIVAAQDFTTKNNDDFRYGDQYLVVYDTKGTIIAHGENSEQVNQNVYNAKDDDGRLYVQEIIKKGKEGGGWIDYKTKNSFESVYVELIDLGLPENMFVITCGVFPVSKSETMMLLAKSAASYLRTNPDEKAFEEFTKIDGKFIRGDLKVFVFDPTGLCYAFGDDYDLIWQNLISVKDEDGKSYIKLFINSVKQGSNKITYKINGRLVVAHVEQVQKNDRTYIVGSSFFK